MYKFFILSLLIALLSVAGRPQIALDPAMFEVFDGKGSRSSLEAIVKALDNVDVVFLGEQHDDAVGHAVQAEIFKRAVETYLSKRNVGLSMEMFERDIQVVVNEYLSGQIT